jgi:alpha-L-rhamnosidase
MAPDLSQYPAKQSSRPYTRWWWLGGPFRQEDIVYQLNWLQASGFGGVELAWLDPTWRERAESAPRPEWLGGDWSELIGFTKRYADEIGLGCDFTFGSGWPFGGSRVRAEDAAQSLAGPSTQRLYGSWEPGPQLVVNHLSARALRRYAEALAPAFGPGLAGAPSALFCDSLELDPDGIWSADLWEPFEARFGYRLEGRIELARTHPHMRYEYRRMVGSTMQREFFETFARICRELGAVSRVQCHGAPTDLLAAYASVDVPESEALLFEPRFSRIAASAAALAGKELVSAETFTCIYGFVGPGDPSPLDSARGGSGQALRTARYWRREQVADLKLLADAVFANGVNQIVWHGMPYNPPGGTQEFYASVHVGPDAAFAGELPAFNEYLETVSGMLRRGRPYTNLAVYLPNEDMLMRDRIPEPERTPGALFEWEMRQVAAPPETVGYHPLWVSELFLRKAECLDGRIAIGGVDFAAIYLDCEWLDAAALEEVVRLARDGAKIVLKRAPSLPGMRRHPRYAEWLAELARLPNVTAQLRELGLRPLVEGPELPPFWAREGDRELLVFFAHPLARDVRYPMAYGQSYCDGPIDRPITIHYGEVSREITLRFEPYQSILLRISRDGETGVIDLGFTPSPPIRDRDLEQ